MDNEITINGVVYVRKKNQPTSKYSFKNGCEYFTFYSCDPGNKVKVLRETFPNMNSFFVGKKGYCGKVCLEVKVNDITVDFMKRLLQVSRDFLSIIKDEKQFYMMFGEEMGRPDVV